MTTGPVLRLGTHGAGAKALCVFVHGRGQSPEDMHALVLARLAAPGVAFYLPRAAEGSWYAAKAVDPLTAATADQLAASLSQLAETLALARAEHPGLPLLLAGFSQGACLSLEYGFAGFPAPQAIAAFTGCRVGAPADDRPLRLEARLPVYLSGGDADPWIPVEAFADAALALGRAGAVLRADVMPGRPHEVSGDEIAMLESLLADLAGGRVVTMAAARTAA